MASNVLTPTKANLLNPIQVAAEVNAALRDNDLVVVEKKNIGANFEQLVYNIYACKGTLEMVVGMQVKHE